MDMNDSLIEIALREMKSKRKPRTLARIAKDVFEVKGLDIKKEKKALAQFQMDFMLSGYFVCCGEDKHGNKVWDLKNRQPSSLLDKDGSLLEDLYEYDEDVLMHELKDDTIYKESEIYSTDDDDEDEVEHDEIEEELLSLDEDEDEEDDIEDDLLDEFDDLDEDEEFLELGEDDDEFDDEI
jgi:DNA-directed RNA polymerase delta subunit